MRNVSFCLLLFSSFGFSQNIQFTDPDLLFYLTTRLCVDTDGNGTFDSTADFNNDDEISFGEAQQVTSFSFTTLAHQIQSLGGFENFINLEKINVTTISVSHLDFSVWPLLQSIKLSSSIDSFVFDNVSLTHLEIQNIGFNDPVFDLTNLPNLEYLKASNNFLNDNFIFGIHNNLEELRINSGTFSSVDLSGMPALKYLSITDFIGTEINISNCTLLETFILRYTDNLNAIIGIGASSVLEKIEFKQVNIGEIPSNLDLVFNNQSLVDVSIRGANSVSISNNISDIGVIELNTINEAIAINNCSFTYIDNFLDSTIEIIGVNSGEIFLTNIENLRTIYVYP
uniref:hypothetical protein n=1 Tax=Flavobacterium sp. TaxID=239 RepID=UPI00404A0F32